MLIRKLLVGPIMTLSVSDFSKVFFLESYFVDNLLGKVFFLFCWCHKFPTQSSATFSTTVLGSIAFLSKILTVEILLVQKGLLVYFSFDILNFGCMCFRVNLHSKLSECQGTPCSKQVRNLKFK